jgi:hypothetical protein
MMWHVCCCGGAFVECTFTRAAVHVQRVSSVAGCACIFTWWVGVISASQPVTVHGCVVVEVLFNGGTGPAWPPAWHAHMRDITGVDAVQDGVSAEGAHVCVCVCVWGGGVWSVSTVGLHAYTCMLTDLRLTRIVKR